VCEILPHLGFQCSVKTFNDTGFRLVAIRGKGMGYLPNWTEELFTVVKCIETSPPVNLVKDDHGEILEGTFYAEELQKVIKTDDVYKIEFCERCGYTMPPYLVKRLRRLRFLCV
jgi:hypothetical protein